MQRVLQCWTIEFMVWSASTLELLDWQSLKVSAPACSVILPNLHHVLRWSQLNLFERYSLWMNRYHLRQSRRKMNSFYCFGTVYIILFNHWYKFNGIKTVFSLSPISTIFYRNSDTYYIPINNFKKCNNYNNFSWNKCIYIRPIQKNHGSSPVNTSNPRDVVGDMAEFNDHQL